jgi:tripartite-type tricarboxylate transporter receptor subunit TctC
MKSTQSSAILRHGMQEKPSQRRRSLKWMTALAFAATGMLFAAQASHAQTYPERPVKIIVAYAPGGSTDIVARYFANELTTLLDQTVIVENRAGGGTIIGTDAAARSEPDGHTLFFGTNAMVINSLLHEKVPYDPVKDFAPVALTTVQSLGVMVNPRLNVDSIPALIAYAKKNPGKINFASSGNGSAQHLAGESFRMAAGIDIVHVPYKGAGPALQDLLAGHVDLMFTSLVGNMEFIKDKKLTLIATTGASRSPATPDVRTVAESGVPGYEANTWQAFFAPANTPKPIIERLNAELRKIGNSAALRKKLGDQGMELRVSSPEALGAVVVKERATYGELLKKIGAKID